MEAHIENRRLFNLAAGKILLEKTEKRHLHACQVCQGVLTVFIKLGFAVPGAHQMDDPDKSTDAA